MRGRLFLLPYGVLLAEVLVFFRGVLFTGRYAIPWDLPTYHLPLASFIARSLRQGQLPLWDSNTYCGFPFFANIQAQLFYPPTLLTMLVSNLGDPNRLIDWLEWLLALHVFLAGIFAYWLLRRLEVGRASALLGATVFQLGGFFASQAQHLGAVCGGAWLPLACLALVAQRDRPQARWTAVLAFSLAMAILAGFPPVTAAVFAVTAQLALLLVALRQASPRLLVDAAVPFLWAGLLSAVQLLPTFQLIGESTALGRGSLSETGGGVPFQALVSLLAPNHYSLFDLGRYSLPWNPTFLYLYCGLAGLVLALAAVLRREPMCRVFALFTLGAALWMLGEATPVGRNVYRALPVAVRSALYAEFAMLGFVLGVAVLTGLGAQALAPAGRWMPAALVALTAIDLVAAGSHRPMNTGLVSDRAMVTPAAFEESPEAMRRIRELVNRTTPPARIEAIRDSMNWAAAAMVTQAPTPHGNDPLVPARVLAVRRLFCRGVPWERYCEASRLDSPVFHLLNVRYIVSGAQPPPGEVVRAGLPQVSELPGHQVYENRDALPRFFLVTRVKPVRDFAEALAALGAPDFDPRRVAVVEGPAALAETEPPPPDSAVRVLDYTPARVLLESDWPRPAFLVTSETHYPGWRAFVDGRKQPLRFTNGAFRGLALLHGRHRIEMRFQPTVLWWGLALSIAATAPLAAVVLRAGAPH